jgi:photosystem II stability/assembly factor-like uncharacterized protein
MKKYFASLLVLGVLACNLVGVQNFVPVTVVATVNLPSETRAIVPDQTGTPESMLNSTQTIIPTWPTSRVGTQTQEPERPLGTATLRINLPLRTRQGVVLTWIQMIDDQVGWGFDTEDHILRTQDAGKTWLDVTPPTGTYNPQGFNAHNALTAWATFFRGYYSKPTTAYVWHTTNGGKTWTASQDFPINLDTSGDFYVANYYWPIKMQFIDPQTGWLLVDVYTGMSSTHPLLFRTTDAGESWQAINDHYHDLTKSVAVGFAFIDSQNGWLGQNFLPLKFAMDNVDQVISNNGWKLIKSNDGGYTFSGSTLLPLTDEIKRPEFKGQPADCGETKLSVFSAQAVGIEWACQIYLTPEQTVLTYALSADGGKTWNTWPASGNEFFLDGFHGWRLLPQGQLQQTENGGKQWLTIKTVAWKDAQLSFIDLLLGWAIVTDDSQSALVFTQDGGRTWSEIKAVISP